MNIGSRNLSFLALGLAIAAGASAQSVWNFGDATAPGSCTQNATNVNGFGNSYGCSVQPAGVVQNLQVSAYANTGTGGNFAAANVGYYGTGSGFGVRNTVETLTAASPNHSMDNSGQQDVLLLKFTDGAKALNQITLGWSQTDSDLTILRWTGAGTPDAGTGNITGFNVGNLLANGWSLVSSLSNVALNTATGFNAGGLTSSYWLVSAYNSTWSGAGDTTLDYVKVLSVGAAAGTPPPPPPGAPEPVSLALVGVALAGAGIARRRTRRG